MYNELTKGDLKKMQEEIDYRLSVVRPKLMEDLQAARAMGDLSENFEYKTAKRELGNCNSRIRYLQRMINTARIISERSAADAVGLYDRVEILSEGDDETEWIQLVTTLRQNVLQGLISRESPLGKALMGKKAGERVTVRVDDGSTYEVEIRTIEKGRDDGSVPINRF
ncbi:MAG: transcription elongation factor GreA [Clostridia bacterium]|nr:transcription elongation factor GreA [Clostridia bacterium]